MTIAAHTSGIYCIRNILNGMRYVGQSINIEKRKKQHFSDLIKGKHHCIFLQRAFDKYGIDNFENEILEIIEDDITIREQYWMDYFSELYGIYNHAPAGGSPKGIKRSEETKKKCSDAKIGIKHSAETKRKMSIAHLNRKDKQRELFLKQIANPEFITARTLVMKDRVISDETKAKISEKSLNMWSDKVFKEKMSKIQKESQLNVRNESAERMRAKWADPAFRNMMIKARQAKDISINV